jgi:hypothetical protein
MSAPTIPYTIPGTVDQDRPEMVCRLAFDGARTSSPTWVDVSNRLRSFSIDRGGENELELIDTGTATVVLDNRDRALDPFNSSSPHSPNVKPRRRLWLQSQWAGVTTDQFYGWTGAFKPEWEGMDAVVSLSAQDGFAILAGDALPTTSPPRDTRAMNLDTLRRLDDNAEAAIRRISLIKLAATILMVYAVAFAVFVLLAALTT